MDTIEKLLAHWEKLADRKSKQKSNTTNDRAIVILSIEECMLRVCIDQLKRTIEKG